MALKDKLMTLEDFKAVRDVDVASNQTQFTAIKADLDNEKRAIDNTDNELFDYEYFPQSITWESGSIYYSSGTNENNTTKRIRTSDKFSLPSNAVGVMAANGYKIEVFAYENDNNASYIGVWQGNGFQKNWYYIGDNIVFFADLPASYKYRVVMKKTDDSAITASDYVWCLIVVSKFLPVENDIANAYRSGGITPIMDDLVIKTKNVMDSFTLNRNSYSFTVGVSNVNNYLDYAIASGTAYNTPPVRIRDFNGELIYKGLRLPFDRDKGTVCMWLFDKKGYYLRSVNFSAFYHRIDTTAYFRADEYFAILNSYPTIDGYTDNKWIVDNVNIEWLNATQEYHVGADKEFTTFTGMLTVLADDPREKVVYIDPGEYDIFEEMGGADYMASLASTASALNWRDVCKVVPPNTHIIGMGDVTLKWDASAEDMQSANVAVLFSPLNISGTCTVENIKVIGRNCRYAVHDETSGISKYDGAVHHYKNCYFECLESTYASTTPYGSGHNKNMQLIFDDCEFVNYQNNAWATHHQPATATQKSTIIFNHCIFRCSRTNSDFSVQFTTDKTNGLKDQVRFNGCYIAAKLKFYTASSSEVQQGYDVTLVGSTEVALDYSANVTTRYDVHQYNATAL